MTTQTRPYLEFEKPIVDIEEQILRLRSAVEAGDLSRIDEAKKLEKKLQKLQKNIYGSLSAYQRVQLARFSERPQTADYINYLIADFVELHGDRRFGDDAAVIGGIGRFEDQPVFVVGQQRGSNTQERIKRNFGQAYPEGNRKAQRLFKLAEKFEIPLILFIDTQGAYAGVEAEERGQAQAIAESIFMLSGLRVPVISIVIGEGGSGGALALGVCDRLLMMEYAVYSVISPESCASILWGKNEPDKVAEYAKVAAEQLKITAADLATFGIADEVIKEPIGGAHRDKKAAAELVGLAINRQLKELKKQSIDQMLVQRYEKFRKIGSIEN